MRDCERPMKLFLSRAGSQVLTRTNFVDINSHLGSAGCAGLQAIDMWEVRVRDLKQLDSSCHMITLREALPS
jgi:hypothetical protein